MEKLIALFSTAIVFLQGIFLGLPCLPAQTITVDPAVRYQQFEGWGTSGAWWAQMVGGGAQEEFVAKALFDDEEGLGLDIYRCNLGGGEHENPNTRIWDYNRKTESFYVWDANQGKYVMDFSRDAKARSMMDAAIAAGATKIILFCNSPHFSMTRSGHASGGLEEKVSNLPRENYQQFVDYVLDSADYFVSQGYPIVAVSPMNEPQWGWGGGWVGQEGCHYTPQEAIERLELFAVNMKQRGVSYSLNGVESGQMSDAFFEWQELFFKSEILGEYCDTFSGHSYWMDNDLPHKYLQGKRFAHAFPDKKFEMSEWCELPCLLDANSIESALYMANVIVQDLTLLNAVSWQSWVAVNGCGERDGAMVSDGLLRAHDWGCTDLALNSRYHAYRHFTAHIGIGAQRICLKNSFGSLSPIAGTAFRDGDKTVLVLVNNAEKDSDIKLRGLDGNMQIITTDAAESYTERYNGAAKAAHTLPAKSITTIICNG